MELSTRTEVEQHATAAGWSIVNCPKCQGRRAECPRCGDVGSLLEKPRAIGWITYFQYMRMEMVRAGRSQPPAGRQFTFLAREES